MTLTNNKPFKSIQSAEIVLFAALILCVACSFFMMDYVPDDSYISFRYAENLADGHGMTFNQGEQPVEGYSNFLWILVCALVYILNFDLPSSMPVVGVLISVFSLTLLWALFRRRGIPALQMLFPLLVFACSGPVVMYAISGMEMPLYTFLLLLFVYLLDSVFQNGRWLEWIGVAVTSFLLALCRPEGMMVFPLVAILMFWFLRGKRGEEGMGISWRSKLLVSLAGFVVVLAVYHFWRFGYFGEWLPTPFLSKGGGGRSFLDIWSANFNFYFIKHMYYIPPMGYYYLALAILGFTGLKFSRSAAPQKIVETIALAFVLVFFVFYFNFKDWMPAMRYYSPYVPLLLFPAVQILSPLFEKNGERVKNARAFWLIGFAVVVLNFGVLAELRVIIKITETSNQLCSVALGKWLKANVPPDKVIAISDVGAIPYYSGLKTIDINPESLTDLYIAKNGFSIDYVANIRPYLIIVPSRSIYVAKFYPEHFAMASDIRFDAYRLLGSSRYDWFDDRSYWVYARDDVPELTEPQRQNFPVGVGSVRRVAK